MPIQPPAPKIRRVLNTDTFNQTILQPLLVPGITAIEEHYLEVISWFKTKLPKWMQLHPDYSAWFKPIKVYGDSDMFSELNLRVMKYKDPSGKTVKLYPETDWDFKDAKANTLCFFESPSRWYQDNAKLVSDLFKLRDTLFEIYQQPHSKVKINTLTVENVLDLHEEFQQKAMARIRLEQEERRRVYQREQLEGYRNRLTSDYEITDPKWEDLKPGIDYHQVYKDKNYTIFNLQTQHALDVESWLQGNCVHGYFYKIQTRSSIVLSVRPTDKVSQSLVTLEVVFNPKCWIVQAETIGNGGIDRQFKEQLVELTKDWTIKDVFPLVETEI